MAATDRRLMIPAGGGALLVGFLGFPLGASQGDFGSVLGLTLLLAGPVLMWMGLTQALGKFGPSALFPNRGRGGRHRSWVPPWSILISGTAIAALQFFGPSVPTAMAPPGMAGAIVLVGTVPVGLAVAWGIGSLVLQNELKWTVQRVCRELGRRAVASEWLRPALREGTGAPRAKAYAISGPSHPRPIGPSFPRPSRA
ncbi:MAG TPA: hypothetical protein VGS23_06580 [Thermoplasmata archaeon]|nr:hypothetical protein [Thermoplasmata archaeon]